jgi:hypothetical protein
LGWSELLAGLCLDESQEGRDVSARLLLAGKDIGLDDKPLLGQRAARFHAVGVLDELCR